MESEEKKVAPKGSLTWLWVLITVVVIGGVFAAWYFTRNEENSDSSSTDEVAEVDPKHSDWQLYTSEKYGFKLYYPTDYTVTTGNTGTLKIAKGTTEVADLYAYAANGDEPGMVKSQKALFTDDTKGYMTGGVESSVTVAGTTGTKIAGTFGKNAGLSQTHTGIVGSVVFFPKNDILFVIDSYDNGDVTVAQIFDDIVADLRF